jgi:hypothetical protein
MELGSRWIAYEWHSVPYGSPINGTRFPMDRLSMALGSQWIAYHEIFTLGIFIKLCQKNSSFVKTKQK